MVPHILCESGGPADRLDLAAAAQSERGILESRIDKR